MAWRHRIPDGVSSSPSTSTVGRVVLEAVVVVLAAAAFGFGANQISPRGLKLARNYFPGGSENTVAPLRNPGASPLPAAGAAKTNQEGNQELTPNDVDQRLKDKGLQPVSRAKVLALFHDPRYQEGPIVFVDARTGEHYEDGHIPGALQLDPYHPEQQMSSVLTACQAAEEVVVYCAGGDCEDADTTAILLREAGVPNQKLFVYGGGYTDWTENHFPVELGARNSGDTAAHAK
jgi:rhodanese-related sulfurtransferase